MSDPPRLRSAAGTPESLLLRSAPSLLPPPDAEREVWRKLTGVLAVGSAASAAGTVAHAAASGGARVAGKLTWITLLKWGSVIAIGAPAVLGAAYVAGRPAKTPVVAAPPAAAPPSTPVLDESVAPAPVPVQPPVAAARSVRTGAPVAKPAAPAEHLDAPSALRAESELLGTARSRLAAADFRGALELVARLQARFPRGRLAQEREVVAIDALSGMGEQAAARARALAFSNRFPDSPYSAHVKHLLEP
jgi:hypothetical protein